MIVKAISLWEPYATAMRLGLKRNETRSWSTDHRGLLMICGAKTRKGMGVMAEASIGDLFEPYIPDDVLIDDWEGWHYGQAAALVRVVDCVSTDIIGNYSPSQSELDLGDYGRGRYAWITEPVNCEFESFPVKGRQRLFDLEIDDEIVVAGEF